MLTDGLRDTDDLSDSMALRHITMCPKSAHAVVLLVQPQDPAALAQRGDDGKPGEAGPRDLRVPGRRLWVVIAVPLRYGREAASR